MSPERYATAEQIDNEAPYIVNTLLKIEAMADKAHIQVLDEQFAAVFEEETEPDDEASYGSMVDSRIQDETPVISPYLLEKRLPVSDISMETTRQSRFNLEQIITGDDDRLIAIVGPCSIHDADTALKYAEWTSGMRKKYGETLEIIMRAYFEKPRTVLGWKGYVNDPELDDSCNMNLGLVKSRMLACQITNMGVPIALERLNALTPQYFNKLIAYDAIGARNTTDPKAREYASGSSSVVGFKNTTDGNILTAVEAVASANAPHVFLGMKRIGRISQMRTGIVEKGKTIGNKYAHIILRGSRTGPNYSPKHVSEAKHLLAKKELNEAIIIDASHDNSLVNAETGKKDHAQQTEVIKEVAHQVSLGETAIRGVMIESNLTAGKQDFIAGATDPQSLEKGLSITDACADLSETEKMLNLLHGAVLARRMQQKLLLR